MQPLTHRLSALTLTRCFLRTYFILAAYNPRGLQNIGLIHALEPGLAALYGQGPALKAARKRYMRHYNCHPFWTPMLVGVFLHLETAIAAGKLPAQVITHLKDSLSNAVSAIGDSFFSGSFFVTWAFVCSALCVTSLTKAAILVTLTCLVLLQLFKVTFFIIGLTQGLAVLNALRHSNFIGWGDKLKCANALLCVCFFLYAMPLATTSQWATATLTLPLAAWLVGKRHVSRILLVAAVVAVGMII